MQDAEETPPCPNCDSTDGEKCPKCGCCIEYGHGLLGGGIGAYKYCTDDDCDFWEKEQDNG